MISQVFTASLDFHSAKTEKTEKCSSFSDYAAHPTKTFILFVFLMHIRNSQHFLAQILGTTKTFEKLLRG